MKIVDGKLEFSVLLVKVTDVQQFVSAAQFYDSTEITVCSQNRKYRVDGKSIMGIFSLDLTKPLSVTVSDIAVGEQIINDIADLVIEE